ncbi:MAG: phosphatase PAP2 family protein [Planctomycetes bacterium]|nr:phosphatase PAP2 family protein [Planctomycetota bacterium]
MDHPAATPEPLLAQAPSTSPAAGIRERLALVGALLVYCMGGYYALGLSQDPLEAGELRLPIDDWIPLIPATIWCYVWVYTVMLYPVFTVRERALFRRVTLAYAVVITISLGFYALLPVTSIHLRPDLSQLDLRVFHNWGLRVNYALDPPLNLFPSLHLSIATLAALCAGRARPLWGYLAIPLVLGIAVSILTVKQHFVVDGVAGLILGAGAYVAFVHATPRGDQPAYGWRGPLAYTGVLLGFYLAFFALFLGGYAPWTE